MKNQKYRHVGTIPKSNINIAERGKINTPNTQIHDRSLSLGTDTSIKSGGFKLILWTQTSHITGRTVLYVKCIHISKQQLS